MNPILMEIVLGATRFLALSGDDVVDPDAAINQLENIAWMLKKLSPEDLSTFVKYAQEASLKERSLGASDETVDFLSNLPEYLGIIDETPATQL